MALARWCVYYDAPNRRTGDLPCDARKYFQSLADAQEMAKWH